MKIGKLEIGKIILAPMAGYTNSVYRTIMKQAGASLVYTEMVSSKGLIYENDLTFEYIKVVPEEKPIAIQLFGGNIEDMVKATKIVCKTSKPDIIDINMGCPVKKVLKQGAGSELLTDINKIYEMVKAVKEASSVPVSVKIRAGVDHNSINCVEVSKAIERAGADLIAIHGRTRSDLYAGKVNLDYIKMVKEAVSIPVVGNGDISSIEEARLMFEYTKCDAIMVGRKTLGNPWLITELAAYFSGKEIPEPPTTIERVNMIKYHYDKLKKIKPQKIALLEMRSLASFYLKGVANIKNVKIAINNANDEQTFLKILDEIE